MARVQRPQGDSPAFPAAPDVLDMFSRVGYRQSMSDAPDLRPATPDEIADTLSFALLYQGRVHHADDAMARITAERLVHTWRRRGSC
jgi:hypothetical protein